MVGTTLVGINAGATQITFSNRVQVALNPSKTPTDLLLRVSDGPKIVKLKGGKVSVANPQTVFVETITAALEHQRVNSEDFSLAIAHPAWWNSETVATVEKLFQEKNVHPLLVNSAEAAITQFQTQATLPDSMLVVNIDSVCASIALVQNCSSDPRVKKSPIRVLAGAGNYLDRIVTQHAVSELIDTGDDIDTSDKNTVQAAKAALNQSRSAREDLSSSSAETFFLDIPGATNKIRLVRSELERITTPWVDSLLDAIKTLAEQCDEDIQGVLITGGLSQMPLISQRISADLGVQVFVPNDFTYLCANGAKKILEKRQTTPKKKLPAWLRIFKKKKPKSAPPPREKNMNDLLSEILGEDNTQNDTPKVPAGNR